MHDISVEYLNHKLNLVVVHPTVDLRVFKHRLKRHSIVKLFTLTLIAIFKPKH